MRAVVLSSGYRPRYGYRVVVHNNPVYVIGGYSSQSTLTNDVWSSADGAVWSHVASDGTLPQQTFGPGISIAGNMCLYAASGSLHDVWCSRDGVTWQQRSDDVPNGTAFVVGNSKSRTWSNDIVWKFADGASWRLGYQNTLHFP